MVVDVFVFFVWDVCEDELCVRVVGLGGVGGGVKVGLDFCVLLVE